MNAKDLFFKKNEIKNDKVKVETMQAEAVKVVDEALKQVEESPDVEMSIRMKNTAAGPAFNWNIPKDLKTSIMLLKLLDMEVSKRIAMNFVTTKPAQSPILRATQGVKSLLGVK